MNGIHGIKSTGKSWKFQYLSYKVRIYKASQSGNVKLVHKLQRLLTSSYYGKLWATRRVTQDNQGKVTAGVDGKKSLNPKQRFELVKNLRIGGKAKPLRRVWIPKANGEKRGLGIPTIEDRALQALVKLGLEPQWESTFENNSYGFRPARSCHDAIRAIFNSIRYVPKYVLDADIAGCFDNIDHKKLLAKLNSYPLLKNQVKAWLESGVMENDNLTNIEKGTPQGGVISPLLANIALHGMELEVKKYARTLKGGKKENEENLSLIRYADDFVILHKDINIILKCKEIIENWLGDIGLELKTSKTHISHTLKSHEGNTGFDFLGFNIRQYPEVTTRMATLLKNQKGKCNHCGLYFKDIDLIEIDHVIPKSLGGKDEYSNQQVLHRHCHDIKSASDGSTKGR